MRRRRLLVDPRLQYELIGWAALVFVVATAVFSGILWFVLHDAQILGESVGMPADHPFFTRLGELRVAAAAAVGVTFFGLGSLVVYGGLLRSRRIIGPLTSLRRHLDEAAQGAPTPMRFRREDHLADIAERYNRLIEALKLDRE